MPLYALSASPLNLGSDQPSTFFLHLPQPSNHGLASHTQQIELPMQADRIAAKKKASPPPILAQHGGSSRLQPARSLRPNTQYGVRDQQKKYNSISYCINPRGLG